MKNPFKSYWVEPKTEEEEKWEVIGLLSGAMLFIFLGLPLAVLISILKDVPELSLAWFGLMGGILAFCFSLLFTGRYWTRLAHNFAHTLYMQGEKKTSLSDDKIRDEKSAS